jgi:NTE family protein
MITTMTSTGGTAFVFTGGGSLGAIQVGMLRTLLSHGVRPDFVVGSSVGAINASYFAAAPNLDGVAALERIWSGLRRSDVFPLTLVSALGLLMHPGNLVDPVGLRRLIETNLPYRCLEEAPLPRSRCLRSISRRRPNSWSGRPGRRRNGSTKAA